MAGSILSDASFVVHIKLLQCDPCHHYQHAVDLLMSFAHALMRMHATTHNSSNMNLHHACRQEEKRKFEEAQKLRQERIDGAGLRQFGTASTEVTMGGERCHPERNDSGLS